MKDVMGAFLSALCAVHCAAGVLLVAGGTSGAAGFMLHSEWMHRLFALFAVVLALWSFPAAYRHHGRVAPTALGTLGIVLLVAGLFFHGPVETTLTVVGAGMAAAAHLWNRYLVTHDHSHGERSAEPAR